MTTTRLADRSGFLLGGLSATLSFPNPGNQVLSTIEQVGRAVVDVTA